MIFFLSDLLGLLLNSGYIIAPADCKQYNKITQVDKLYTLAYFILLNGKPVYGSLISPADFGRAKMESCPRFCGISDFDIICIGGLFIKTQKMLSVGEFSKITRTSAKALRYYDKIGLLSPITRGENNYRYYSVRQLALCNAIRVLLKLGVPLAEIRGLKDTRTPEIVKGILARQTEALDAERDRLNQAYMLLDTYAKEIQSGLSAGDNSITIQFLPAKSIIVGEPNNCGDNKTNYDALFDFYQSISNKCPAAEYELLHPVCGMHSAEKIIRGDCTCPERYFFYNPSGQDERPAAMYAIGHMRAGYGQVAMLCARMREFIDRNGFEICGTGYEEYPLNEICVSDDTNYLLRLMITVREKPA